MARARTKDLPTLDLSPEMEQKYAAATPDALDEERKQAHQAVLTAAIVGMIGNSGENLHEASDTAARSLEEVVDIIRDSYGDEKARIFLGYLFKDLEGQLKIT